MDNSPTTFHIGTAGWSYLKWDKEFYPKGTKPAEKLAYYTSQFNAVELNNSFYHLPTREQLSQWEAQAPDDFRFAVKASRFITHIKRLKDPADTLPDFLAAISEQQKPGPLFFQLPPKMALDVDRLKLFLSKLPKRHRYAIEMRDPAWHVEPVYALLRKHNVAFCLYDIPEAISPRVLTADFAYVRLRGRDIPQLTEFLREWQDWLSTHSKEAFVFFDNREDKSLAFGNALRFRDLVQKDMS